MQMKFHQMKSDAKGFDPNFSLMHGYERLTELTHNFKSIIVAAVVVDVVLWVPEIAKKL